MRSISTDCKQRSSAVRNKAPTASKKASPRSRYPQKSHSPNGPGIEELDRSLRHWKFRAIDHGLIFSIGSWVVHLVQEGPGNRNTGVVIFNHPYFLYLFAYFITFVLNSPRSLGRSTAARGPSTCTGFILYGMAVLSCGTYASCESLASDEKFDQDCNFKNLLMPLFLMGCFAVDFQEGKRPLRTKSGKRPIKVGKRPIKEGKRPIKTMVLVGISVDGLMGSFRAPPPCWKTAPLKRPIKRSMIIVNRD